MTENALAAETNAAPSNRRRLGEILLAFSVAALGVVTIVDGISQPRSTSASGLGAGQFPIIVGAFTLVLAVLLAVSALRGKLGEPEQGEGDIDANRMRGWQAFVVLGALVFFCLSVEPLGYVIAAFVTFIAVAFAAGSRRPLTTIAVGAALSLGIFYLFTLALQIRLPAGVLQGIL